jgi:hypothetical protein
MKTSHHGDTKKIEDEKNFPHTGSIIDAAIDSEAIS